MSTCAYFVLTASSVAPSANMITVQRVICEATQSNEMCSDLIPKFLFFLTTAHHNRCVAIVHAVGSVGNQIRFASRSEVIATLDSMLCIYLGIT